MKMLYLSNFFKFINSKAEINIHIFLYSSKFGKQTTQALRLPLWKGSQMNSYFFL
jgi:hypothetical protein